MHTAKRLTRTIVVATSTLAAVLLAAPVAPAGAAPLEYPFCEDVGAYTGSVALASVAPGCPVTWSSTLDQPGLRARLTRGGVTLAEVIPSASTVMVPQEQLTCGEPTQTVSVVLYVRTAHFPEAQEGDLVEFTIDTVGVGSASIGAVEDTCLPIDFAGAEPCYLSCGEDVGSDPSLGCSTGPGAGGPAGWVGLLTVGALALGRRRRSRRSL